MAKGFKHCFYDRKKKKMYLKEQDDTDFKVVEFHNWCYRPDRTKKSNINDIYKNPMVKFDYDDPETIANLKNLAEAKLRPEVKLMHKMYDFEELEVDINKWNICLFDIEVAGSSKYYNAHLIKVKRIEDERQFDIKLFDFDMKYRDQHDKFLVWDTESNKWAKYEDSCFVSYEFPAPEKADWPINAVTCYSTKTDQTYTWGLEPYTDDEKDLPNYTYCESEVILIQKWSSWFARQKFDIISGWNSISYDIPYVMNRCQKLREINDCDTIWEKHFSPLGMPPECEKITDRKMKDVELGMKFDIPGMYSLDYMKIYETFGSHPPLPSYSLNYVANLELDDQKLDYTGAISETYKFDWNNFLKYNRKDVLLLRDLEHKNKLFSLLIEYAFDCLVTLDKVEQKVPTTTGYILKFLHKTNRVLNDRETKHVDWWRNEKCYIVKDKNGNDYFQNTEWEPDSNGYPNFCKFKFFYDSYKEANAAGIKDLSVIRTQIMGGNWKQFWKKEEDFNTAWKEYREDPHPFKEFAVKAGYCYDYPGRHDDCMSFDITSSYPHHIMQFYISPENKCIHPTKEQIESGEVIPSDVNELGFYRNEDAILPNVVKQVFAERKIYKNKEKECHKKGDFLGEHLYHNRQMTKKLIINSVYGVSLTESFALYDPDVARSICRCARCTLRDWLTKGLNKYYVSQALIKDVEKEFSTVEITVDDKIYKFGYNDKITVLRNEQELELKACEFNKDTDLLGI